MSMSHKVTSSPRGFVALRRGVTLFHRRGCLSCKANTGPDNDSAGQIFTKAPASDDAKWHEMADFSPRVSGNESFERFCNVLAPYKRG
jgi:hypothetical protein